MHQRIWRAILYVAIALAIGLGAWQAVREERLARPLAPGTPAPPLSGLTREGRPFELAELRGQVVILSFWASWCGPCQRELPMLLALEQAYAARGVRLVSVNLDAPHEREEAIRRFFAELGARPPLVVYVADETVHAFRALRLPTLYLLSAEGTVVAGHTDLQDEKVLRAEIEAALQRP